MGLLAAPAAWIIQTVVSYASASYACYPHDAPLSAPSSGALWAVLSAMTIAALAIGIAGWIASRNAWRATREEISGSSGHHALEVGEGRTRFLALGGMMVSVLFIAAIIFNAVGLVVLPPCG